MIDTNDAPTGITLLSQGIYENATAGTVVGTLRAQDQDANQTHTFSVTSGIGKRELLDALAVLTPIHIFYFILFYFL